MLTAEQWVQMVLPLVTGVVIPRLLDYLKSQSDTVNGLPRTAKQGLAFFLSAVLVTVGTLVLADPPTTQQEILVLISQAFVGGLTAIALKSGAQVQQLKAAQEPLP